MKGLQRSVARAPALQQPVTKVQVQVKNLAINVANGSSAPGFGTVRLAGLPQGNLLILGAVGYLQFTSADADVIATYDGDVAVGSAPATDATLTGTKADILPSTALGAATAKLSPLLRITNASQAILDNTDGSLELNLNLLIDDASQSGAVDLTANGRIMLAVIVLGDD